ncbi:response regulator [uncultured Piscinibacter sp.]|uniref:response regulator n=1 Tax=uncultured Piscinibacter sp. TaxID=1131835 RepID=UPI00262C3E2C|nr:response regulator [uncultured Piscinibacter sp.]
MLRHRAATGRRDDAAISTRYHVHVVDAEAAHRDALARYLESHGLAVTVMGSADELLRRMHRHRPDLIVMDTTLPGLSGLQACRQLRAEGDRVPLILLSARNEEVDRVLGLEMGADDLLGKPCSLRELLARVHAVLRRSIVPPGLPMLAAAPVAFGALQFDVASRCLVCDGHVQVLGTVEYAVLAELVANPGVAVSRERLLAVSHGRAEGLLPRAVDVAVMRLRKRIEPDPARPRHLQTVRGHGYMFVPAAPSDAAPRRYISRCSPAFSPPSTT